jgi:hypothetical protein
MDDASRRQLASDQARLIAALVAHAPVPPGFDARRVRLSGRSLIQKRMRAVERIWPELARVSGDEFTSIFAEYARQNAARGGGARDDAVGYARELAGRKLLPVRLRVRLCIIRLTTWFNSRR